MADTPNRMRVLADALQALTYREMKDLADAFVEAIDATNGMKIKADVIAEVLDSIGEYVEIEAQAGEAR